LLAERGGENFRLVQRGLTLSRSNEPRTEEFAEPGAAFVRSAR
jgi:hypothetical protein